jgi:hypothetical protein
MAKIIVPFQGVLARIAGLQVVVDTLWVIIEARNFTSTFLNFNRVPYLVARN